MLSIKLFRLLFCLFWFNQNTETLCFGIEAKQPKQTICFGCFESKLVLKDTLRPAQLVQHSAYRGVYIGAQAR